MQEGDTLSDIAQRSGWGENYQGLAEAAGIDNPDVINVGQEYDLGKPKGAEGGNDLRDLSTAGGKWGAPAAQSAEAAGEAMKAFGAEPAPAAAAPAPVPTPAPEVGKVGSLALAQYIDWCDSFGVRRASIDSLDKYAANLNDQAYFEIASALTDPSSPIYRMAETGGGSPGGSSGGGGGNASGAGGYGAQYTPPSNFGGGGDGWTPPFDSSYSGGDVKGGEYLGVPGTPGFKGASRFRTAAPDYLQKADEALTNLLNQKAEEFQETIAPLQQALQTVQQAEQAQAAMNPMAVQPPAGTVNVLPGGGGDPAAGGMPPGGGDPSQGGGNPMAGLDPAMLQQLLGGDGDPSGSQGGPPPGGDPSQQMMMARRKRQVVNRGKGRGANAPHHAGIVNDVDEWGKQRGVTTGNPEVDMAQFQSQTGKPIGPKQRNKLTKPISTANPMPKSKAPISTGMSKPKQASVEFYYGELDSDTGSRRLRGQRSGSRAEPGSGSPTSNFREADFAGEDFEALHYRKAVSGGNSAREAAINSLTGSASVSWGAEDGRGGSTPQRQPSRQSPREPGVRNSKREFSGHGSSPNSVAAEENSLSRRAFAGSSKPNAKPIASRSSSVSGVRKGKDNSPNSPRTNPQDGSRSSLSKDSGKRLAWTGFGSEVFARKVPGWEFDAHLNGYVATAARDFTCSCGEKHPTPSYSTCKCGKIHNSYVIGTGGDNHQASVEKFICREIPVRKDVIVANRRRKTAMPWIGGLNVADSAPPSDRPIMLSYGGAFNPPHQGHVQALQDAQDALSGAGYNVAGTVVAPTADKLLAGKEMDPAHRLNLQSRANVVRAAFPKDINGAPITVDTGPSEEVEQAMGKPRRTDLARWIQQRYPDHTVVNVTGEDALVPGAPDQHPSIYSGAPGSNHEGFAYLTMPRDPDESMSSSKIRAALAAGQPLPGMTPESERAYRDELAKLRAQFKQADIIKYTEDEEEEPIRTGGKVKRHNLSDPGPLGDGKDDKMPDISEDLGQDWYKRGPGGKYARKNRRSR